MTRGLHGSTLLATLAGLLLGSVIVAPLAHAEPECLNGSWDFDNDQVEDLAIGAPGAPVGSVEGAGMVQVRVSNEDDPFVIEVPNPSPDAGDRFGAAITELASYDEEGQDAQCTQLVVGAPGDDSGAADAGSVYVYSYNQQRREFTLRSELRQGSRGVDGSPQAGAGFGSALAATTHVEDIAPIIGTLYVGSPGRDNGSAKDVGAVTSLMVSPDEGGEALQAETFSWGDGARFDARPTPNGRFGAAIAVSVGGVVFFGAPGQGTAGQAAGGAVAWQVRSPSNGTVKRGWFSQASAGVPGSPETGDLFGSALATDDTQSGPRVLVGAPGEAVGTRKAAGGASVVPFTPEGVVDTRGAVGIDQSSAGVAGEPEAGDRLGAAVSVIDRSDSSRGLRSYLAGVPGESIGTALRTGMVQTFAGGLAWHQASAGVPGTAESDDAMGSSLIGRVIGVPGEDGGAGRVIAGLPISGAASQIWTASSPTAGGRFGAAVAGAVAR